MISPDDTRVILEYEMEGATGWSARHKVDLRWFPSNLEIHATFFQPGTKLPFFVRAVFPDYKELPPVWNLCDDNWVPSTEKFYFPKPKQPVTPSSIFIEHNGKGVICAPFNRLAFSIHGGPHQDWGDIAQWQSAAGSHIHATTVPDMLQAVRIFMNRTEGRMGEK